MLFTHTTVNYRTGKQASDMVTSTTSQGIQTLAPLQPNMTKNHS